MKKYFKFKHKDGILFGPIETKESWYVFYDLNNKAKGVLFTNEGYTEDEETVDKYDKMARLMKVFPVYHLEIDNFKEQEFLKEMEKTKISRI